MKTILQQTEVAYNATTVKDAIQMLPLMDWLKAQAIKELTLVEYNSLPKEEKTSYKWAPSPDIKNANAIYALLVSLGFCSSTDEPIKSRLEDYKKE